MAPSLNLNEKQKRILRWAGYPALALVTFVMTLHWTFPYDRVTDKMSEMFSDKYDVTVARSTPTLLPGGLVLHTVVLRTRPSRPDEMPTTIIIDRVRVDIGLLALLGGKYDVDLDARVGNGRLQGEVVVTRGKIKARLSTKGLPLGSVPGLKQAVGLPVSGGLDAKLSLDVPRRDNEVQWPEADGKIRLSCPGCTAGDGETQIKPRPAPAGRIARPSAFSAGVTVPRLDLGELVAEIEIRKGKGEVKQFMARSADGELYIDGELVLERRFADWSFPGCMKFRLSDELKEREPNFGNLPALMGVGLNTDGYANVRMRGKLTSLQWLPTRECDIGFDDDGDDDSRRPPRPPTITSRPTQPERPELPAAVQPGDEDGDAAAARDPVGAIAPPGLTVAPPPYEGQERELSGPGTSGPELSGTARGAGRQVERVDDVRPAEDVYPEGSAQPDDYYDDEEDDDVDVHIDETQDHGYVE